MPEEKRDSSLVRTGIQGQVDQDNFIQGWLVCGNPAPIYTAFRHIPLVEIEDVREVVFVPFAETVFIYHNDPEEYHQNLEALGYSKAAKEIDQRPLDSNTRKANFGEILASEYLRQCLEYTIPIYRLRHSSNPDSSMKGDDVLAFKFGESDGQSREILVVEVKVRTHFASEIVQEAYRQLENGLRPYPTSLIFVVNALRKEGRDDEANQVLRFLDKFISPQPVRRHMIFIVTGNNPRDPFRCIQEQGTIIEDFIACDVCISDLGDFVNALFDYEVEIDGT